MKNRTVIPILLLMHKSVYRIPYLSKKPMALLSDSPQEEKGIQG